MARWRTYFQTPHSMQGLGFMNMGVGNMWLARMLFISPISSKLSSLDSIKHISNRQCNSMWLLQAMCSAVKFSIACSLLLY